METVRVDQHWYLTEDKERVVPEGNPQARWLWATPGMDVPRADAERLGAAAMSDTAETGKAELPTESEVAESTEDTKAAPKPADKQRTKPGDKSTSMAELRKQATGLGVQVDNRWGVERLRQEIANVEGGD